MRPFAILLLVIIAICGISDAFTINSIIDYTRQGYKSVTSKFGDRYWHKNTTDLEEVVLDGS